MRSGCNASLCLRFLIARTEIKTTNGVKIHHNSDWSLSELFFVEVDMSCDVGIDEGEIVGDKLGDKLDTVGGKVGD